MDLTELTDMSDQELAEVFADSDEEAHSESPAGNAWLINKLFGCLTVREFLQKWVQMWKKKHKKEHREGLLRS